MASAPPAGFREHYADGIRGLRRSRPFRMLLSTFVLQALATGLMLAGAQYVATWVLHSEAAVELLFIALIAPALFAAPAWGVVARRIGKERTFSIASVVFAVAALSILGMLWAPGDWIYAPVAIAGIAYAGMQSLPMSMLPDVISHDERTSRSGAGGTGRAGSFSGVWTAGETVGFALGATALAIILAVTGYVSSTADETVDAAGCRHHRHRRQLQPRPRRAGRPEPAHARAVPAAPSRHRVALTRPTRPADRCTADVDTGSETVADTPRRGVTARRVAQNIRRCARHRWHRVAPSMTPRAACRGL